MYVVECIYEVGLVGCAPLSHAAFSFFTVILMTSKTSEFTRDGARRSRAGRASTRERGGYLAGA